MQDPELEEIDLPHVLWYFQELERLGWKPNGMNLIAIALRKFFEYCNLRGYPTFNEQLIPMPERQFNIPRVTDINAFRKLLEQIPKGTNNPHHLRNRALLLMLWDTGARSGEVCLIDGPLDHKTRTTIIKTEKSRGRRPIRQIFWTEETNKALKAWLKKKKELEKFFKFNDPEAIFVSISKCPDNDIRGRRMNNRSVAEVLRMLSCRAGLPARINAHSVRHSMGRDAVRTLRSDSSVSNILGHSNIESSQVYTMLFGTDLRDEWKRVIKSRGNPMHPQMSKSFPKSKFMRSAGPIQGSNRRVSIHTSKYGRMEKF